MTTRRPVAVLGGTFDPIHFGHLRIARRVLARTGLDRLLVLPAALPPHKDPPGHASAEHRAAMVRLAIADQPRLEFCAVELEDGGVCYTIDTLRRLRRPPHELDPLFVMGLDSLVELPTWRDYRELVREFDLLVVNRPGLPFEAALRELDPDIAPRVSNLEPSGAAQRLGAGGRIFLEDVTPIPISSSEIRARAAQRRSLGGLVPLAVARYIRRNRLYVQEERR